MLEMPSRNTLSFLSCGALEAACLCILLGVPHSAQAQKPSPPTSAATVTATPSAIAEAAREDGETLYEGVVAEPVKNGAVVLSVARIVPPNGKAQIVSPARKKTVRLTGEVALRLVNASSLEMTQADLLTGARVFVLGAASAKGTKPSNALNARVIMVAIDGSEPLPGNLLKPWNVPANWTFRANANSAPGSVFEADTGSLHLKVGGMPVREWHAQIFQQLPSSGGGIAPGKPYTLRFLARADTNHFVTIGSQTDSDSPYKNAGLLQTVLFTPRWQVFQVTFTSAPDTIGPQRLPVFSAAHRGGDVFLANISLVPGALPLPPALQAERDKQVAPNTNLIDHANEADAWQVYEAGAARGALTQSSEPGGGKTLQVTINTPSSQAYHFQLLRPALPLLEGRTYELRFLAKASRKRTLDVEGQATIGGDIHNIGLSKIVDLDTAWKEYTVRFTTKNVVENNSHAPQFCFAQEAGTVWLANVSLKLLP